jgi:hypothetical protein
MNLRRFVNLLWKGESIDLDNLPDERLREIAWRTLFIGTRTRKSREMENDESDNEGRR